MEEQVYIFLKVLGAMILGAFIGFERERANKAAGLRTHIFVAGGAAFFAGIAIPLIDFITKDLDGSMIQADPIRVIEATITGVAFLGAGTIIKGKDDTVSGLTTAASLLLTAAAGVAMAIDLYILAISVALSVFVILRILGRINFMMRGKS